MDDLVGHAVGEVRRSAGPVTPRSCRDCSGSGPWRTPAVVADDLDRVVGVEVALHARTPAGSSDDAAVDTARGGRPSSTTIRPAGAAGERDPELAAREALRRGAGTTVPTDAAGEASVTTSGSAAAAITARTPTTPRSWPPRACWPCRRSPARCPRRPRRASSAASTSTISSMSEASASTRGIGGEQPGGVGEQQQQVGVDQVRHQRGEAVVVAVADLVVGDGVVLVDDRETPRSRRCCSVSRACRYCEREAEVVGREQHLPGDDTVRAEHRGDALHQAGLADRGDRLQRADVGRAGRQPERGHARPRSRPSITSTTCVPGGAGRREVGGTASRSAASSSSPVGRRDRRRADLHDDRAIGPSSQPST